MSLEFVQQRGPMAVIQGRVDKVKEKFYLPIITRNGVAPVGPHITIEYALDTGAFEILLPPEMAAEMDLVALSQPFTIGGVTGGENAWATKVDVLIAGETYNTNAVVAPTPDPLFGFRFFRTRRIPFLVDPFPETLSLFAPR